MKTLRIIILSSLLLSCAALKKMVKNSSPTIKTGQVTVENLSFDGIDLLLDLHVTNPNPIEIPLTGLSYIITMNEKPILSGKKTDNPKVSASTTSTIQLPFHVSFSDIQSISTDILSKDEIKLDIKSELFFTIPLVGAKSITFETSQTVPIPKIPTLKVGKFSKKDISFSGATLVFEIEINNPNSVALKLNDLNYAFSISGNELLKSGISNTIVIPKNAKKSIPIEFKVNFINAGIVLYNTLQNSSNLNYSMNGSFNSNLDLPYFPTIKKSFSSAGKLSTN